jgi:hypothetical protein
MVKRRLPAPAGPEAEIARLRAILWEIVTATGTDTGKLKHAPGPGKHNPDVPEWALEAVMGLRAELVEYTGLTGADVNEACGPDEACSCGETVTWYGTSWHHLFNANLQPSGGYNHRPVPVSGYYSPTERRAAEERRNRGETPHWRYDGETAGTFSPIPPRLNIADSRTWTATGSQGIYVDTYGPGGEIRFTMAQETSQAPRREVIPEPDDEEDI